MKLSKKYTRAWTAAKGTKDADLVISVGESILTKKGLLKTLNKVKSIFTTHDKIPTKTHKYKTKTLDLYTV